MDLLAAGLGLLSTGEKFFSNLFNLNQENKTLDWQKFTQQRTWEREDTAVQRRVADLQAAGLNPILAAGSAAQTSSPIHVDTPRMGSGAVESGINAAGAAMSLMRQRAEIEKTSAEIDYIKMQKNKVSAETIGQELGNRLAEGTNEYRTDMLRLDYELKKQMNPMSIRAAANSLDLQDLEKTNRDLDIQLKSLGIAPAKARSKTGEYIYDLARFTRNEKEQEVIMKKLMIETQKHNLEVYRKLNLPTNTGINLQNVGVTKGADIGSAISDALQNIFGGKPK